MKKEVMQKIERISSGILELAGIFATENQTTTYAGVSRTGADVFTSKALASSPDITLGAQLIFALAGFVAPFNVLSKKEDEALKRAAKDITDRRLYAVLDKLYQDQKGDTFAATLIKAAGAPVDSRLSIVCAVKVYDHWGVMSPAQKSMVIAAMGIQLHKTPEGGPVCDLVIVSGEGLSFKVQDALNMLQAGKNAYPLVDNWDQIYRLLKVYNDKPTIESMIDFATSHNLLGRSQNGAAVPGVSPDAIKQAGGKPAPQYGVGALATPKGTPPPPGYASAADMPGGSIVVPNANADSAVGAFAGSLVGTKAGKDGISGDATRTYSKWNKADAKGVDKGSLGGSALVAGLTNLKSLNPYLYSAMVAFLARYSHGRIDSSNKAQYGASLAGIALARIVSGKSEEKADRDGVAVAQAVHSSAPDDFAKLQINIRAAYANFGVSSKADAYQLSNQAFAEGRVNESDLVAMQEIYNVVYDKDGLGTLGKLLQGMDKGLQIAKMNLTFKNKMQEAQKQIGKAVVQAKSKEEIRARNAARYQQPQQQEAPEQEAAEPPAQQGPQEEQSEVPAGA